MKNILLVTLLSCAFGSMEAQFVASEPDRTLNTGKEQVTALAMAPRGDRMLVGTTKGAALFDIESGKKVQDFPFKEDDNSTVWHASFNDNGEFVLLIGYTGKREVWDVKSGKIDKMLNKHGWIPDPRQVKAMGLNMGNSDFDRFYQQTEAVLGEVRAVAQKNGAVQFITSSDQALQQIEFPQNKDQHHRAPCMFSDTHFITGTDDGRVLFYPLVRR